MKLTQTSLESDVHHYLWRNKIAFTDNRKSLTEADFILHFRRADFHLEVKEKRQHVKLSNWPETNIKEEHLFILDELTAKRLMSHVPYAGVLIRDNLTGIYSFLDVLGLWLMPKIRANRVLNDQGQMKGKWMLDQRNGLRGTDLQLIFPQIFEWAVEEAPSLVERTACYGVFSNEQVPNAGEYRTKEQRQHDYAETR